MKLKIKNKNILTLDELDSKELQHLLELAIELKKQQKKGNQNPVLQGKTLAMIFEKPSTRTRVSFEVAMLQLGGHAIALSSDNLQTSRGETISDTAKTLSRYVDVIMARVYEHETLENLAEHASVPIINGLSDSYHPCQILADLMTIKEHKKNLKKIKIAWIGDGNNVCNSLILGCSKLNIEISVATPGGFEPSNVAVSTAKLHTQIEITDDPSKAVEDADAVMTDTFVSIHNDEKDRLNKFLPKFQVNSD